MLVVGGGPAGFLLTGELALCGVSVALTESLDEVVAVPRGGLIHARTRQVLARRGLVSPESTRTSWPYHYGCVEGALTLRSPEHEYGAEPQYWPQAEFVRILERRCLDLGVRVYRRCRLRTASSTGDYVESVCETAVGKKTFRSRWIVGADGARSTVREAMGLSFSITKPSMFGVSFFVERTPGAERLPLGWTRLADGVVGVNLESASTSRIMWMERTGRAPSAELSDDMLVSYVVGKLAEYIVENCDIRLVGSVSRFSDRSRLADSFRRGRAILIGDAAHTQSPLGAQGTNLAVMDAVGLGWRLAQSEDAFDGGDCGVLDAFLDHRRQRAVHVARTVSRQTELLPPVAAGIDLRTELTADKLCGVAELISGQDDPPPISVTEVINTTRCGVPAEVSGPRFLTNCTVKTARGQKKTLSNFLSQHNSPARLYLADGVAHTRRVPGAVAVRITPEGTVAV